MEKLIEAALEMIEPKMTVSFGGGRTVGRLIKAAKDNRLDIKLASPSEATRALCKELELPVTSLEEVSTFDLAFDGCDSLDHHLNALKSNGGIHVLEKVYANLSKRYVILAPEARFTKVLNPDIQLTLEVLDLAMPQVIAAVEKLGGTAKIRQSSDIAGMVRTKNGNGLLDCHFDDWSYIDEIDTELGSMVGVMGTSYFKDIVTDALLATDDGVKHVKREI